MCIEELTCEEEIDLVEWKRRGAVAETVVRVEEEVEEVEANKALGRSVGSEQAVPHRRASIATTSLQHTLTHRLRKRAKRFQHTLDVESSTGIDLESRNALERRTGGSRFIQSILPFGSQGSKVQFEEGRRV